MINISLANEDGHSNDVREFAVLHMCKSECGGNGNNIPIPVNNFERYFNSAINRNLIQTELKEWEILLAVIKNDNGVLILQLSRLVDENSGMEFLSKAEYFQNEFIARDEYLQELEKDINEQVQIVKDGKKLLPLFSKNQDKLRNEINAFKKNYVILKSEFGTYFLDKK